MNELKQQVLEIIEKEFSDVENVNLFKERINNATSQEEVKETIELLQKASVAKKEVFSEDPWVDLLIRVQKNKELTRIFKHLKKIDPTKDLTEAEEQLGSIMCIGIDDNRYVFLNPETLEYSYCVGSVQAAHLTLAQSNKKYHEYFNPGIIHTRTVTDSEGNVKEKKRTKEDIYTTHVRTANKRIVDITANCGFALSRDKGKLVVRESGLELVDVKATHHQICEDWLRLITGDEYEKVVTWIAHSTDFGTAMPILSIIGAPNTGKSLLVKALGELFEHSEASITPDTLFDEPFNGAILSNPFVVADDGGFTIDSTNKELWTDRLKQFLSRNSWSVNPKFGKQVSLIGYLRAYFAFNHDKQHVRSLFTTPNEALGQRVLDIEVPAENVKKLTNMFRDLDVYGENNIENRWLGPNGKLTEHITHLIQNKHKYPLPSINGRWGNMVGYKFVGKLATTKDNQVVIDFFQESLENRCSFCPVCEEDPDIVRVYTQEFLAELKEYDKKGRFTRNTVAEVMQSLGASPSRNKLGRHWIVSLKKSKLMEM